MKPRPVLALVATVVTLAVLLAAVAVSSETHLWKLVLIALALGLPGALSAGLHPHNPVGWLLLTVGLLFSCMSLATQWVDAGHESVWASWVADRSGAVVVPLTTLALLLLPDGRLPSPRWRPVVTALITAQLVVIGLWSLVEVKSGPPNPLGLLPASWAGPVDATGSWVLQLPFTLVVVAIVVRLRRREDRARLAGVLWGAGCFATLALVGHALWPAGSDAIDALGAMLLGAGLTTTLLRQPVPARIDWSTVRTPELSVRERQVLELVAEGLTNREIAERLFISPVTARNHVSRILTKLGLENRTQAATWLSRRGTTPASKSGPD